MLVDNLTNVFENHKRVITTLALSGVLLLSGCAQALKRMEGANITEFKPSISCPTENGPVEIGNTVSVSSEKGSGLPAGAKLISSWNGGYYNLCKFGNLETQLADDEGYVLARLQVDNNGNLKYRNDVMFRYNTQTKSFEEIKNIEDLHFQDAPLGRLKSLTSQSNGTVAINPSIPSNPIKEITKNENQDGQLIGIGSLTVAIGFMVVATISVIRISRKNDRENEKRIKNSKGIFS